MNYIVKPDDTIQYSARIQFQLNLRRDVRFCSIKGFSRCIIYYYNVNYNHLKKTLYKLASRKGI